MTVSTTISRKQYLGNGVTTVFPYNFGITAEADLKVILTDIDGTPATLVLNTDYTVSGAGAESGGNVTYPISGDPAITGEVITLVREVSLDQLTDFLNQGGFFPETHEDAFDKAAYQVQSMQEQLDRCPKFAENTTEDPEKLSGTVAEQLAACEAAADRAEAAAEAAEGEFKYALSQIKTATHTLVAADRTYLNIMDSATAETFNLPAIIDGHVYLLKNIGAGILTLNPNGVQTSDITRLKQNQGVILQGGVANTHWNAIGANIVEEGVSGDMLIHNGDGWVSLPKGSAQLPLKMNSGATGQEYAGLKEIGGGTGQTGYAAGDTLYAGAADVLSKLPKGSFGQLFRMNPAGTLPEWGSLPTAIIVDQKANNTNGGTFTQGAWRTRDLTVIKLDDIGISLSSNEITLPAGKYSLRASMPGHQVQSHKTRLYNVTDTSVIDTGTRLHTSNGTDVTDMSMIDTVFTLAATKAIRIEHICGSTKIDAGFGFGDNIAGDSETEKYTQVHILRLG